MKRMKNLRQGQTRWLLVVYEPDRIAGYEHQHVAFVYGCYITKVRGTTVFYRNGAGPYLAGRSWFLNNTEPTFRKALAKGRAAIAAIDRSAT